MGGPGTLGPEKHYIFRHGCGAVTFLVGSGSGSGEAFRPRLQVKIFGGSGSGSGQNVPAPAAPMLKSS